MQTATGISARAGFIFGTWVRSCSQGLQKNSGVEGKARLSPFPVQGPGEPGQSRALPRPRGGAEGARGRTAPARRPPPSALQVGALTESSKRSCKTPPDPLSPGRRRTAAVRRERLSQGEYSGGRPGGGCPTHGGSRAGAAGCAEPREGKGQGFGERGNPWLGCWAQRIAVAQSWKARRRGELAGSLEGFARSCCFRRAAWGGDLSFFLQVLRAFAQPDGGGKALQGPSFPVELGQDGALPGPVQACTAVLGRSTACWAPQMQKWSHGPVWYPGSIGTAHPCCGQFSL